MARAGAAVVLAFAVCCLLVAPAPARRPIDVPPRALHAAAADDREASAEKLLHQPKPEGAADCDEAAEQGTALAVPGEDDDGEEEEPRRLSSLLCVFFQCGGEPAADRAKLDEWAPPAVPGKEEAEGEKAGDVAGRPYEMGSDSDCDSDSDDDEEEDGILGWLWSLADRF